MVKLKKRACHPSSPTYRNTWWVSSLLLHCVNTTWLPPPCGPSENTDTELCIVGLNINSLLLSQWLCDVDWHVGHFLWLLWNDSERRGDMKTIMLLSLEEFRECCCLFFLSSVIYLMFSFEDVGSTVDASCSDSQIKENTYITYMHKYKKKCLELECYFYITKSKVTCFFFFLELKG